MRPVITLQESRWKRQLIMLKTYLGEEKKLLLNPSLYLSIQTLQPALSNCVSKILESEQH